MKNEYEDAEREDKSERMMNKRFYFILYFLYVYMLFLSFAVSTYTYKRRKKGKYIFSVVIFLVFAFASNNFTVQYDQVALPDIEYNQPDPEQISKQSQFVIVKKFPEGIGTLRSLSDPSGKKKPGSKNDILMTVPNGWMFKLLDTHDDMEKDESNKYIWWEVENPGNDIKGWIESYKLDKYGKKMTPRYLLQKDNSEKVMELKTKEERAEKILEAVDYYYNRNDEHFPDHSMINLYNSNDWGYNDREANKFFPDGSPNADYPADIITIHLLRDNRFPIELILAIASHESGMYDFDNEIYDQKYAQEGDIVSAGVGIMQIHGSANRGWASNLKYYADISSDAYLENGLYKHGYYTNTVQGIYANVKDGMQILSSNYEKRKDEKASWIHTIWRNNPFSVSYPYMVISKINDLKSDLYFGPNYKKMISKKSRLLNNSEKADLLKKIANYCTGYVFSPVEIRIRDSKGRVTGLVNGEVSNEIPDSEYYNEAFLILKSDDVYSYEIVGTKEDVYSLRLSFVINGKVTTFNADDIPTSPGAVHKYTIDWGTLSQAGQGVTVQIDSNGDGTFEQSIASDSEFTKAEYSAIKTPDAEGKS